MQRHLAWRFFPLATALPVTAPGSEEDVTLEVYMNARSNGLKMETPAIRY